MQFELSDQDKADMQTSIMQSAVGKALTSEVICYLNSSYKMSQTVQEVLKDEVRSTARRMIEEDEELKAKIVTMIQGAFTDELLEKVANKITVSGY